MRLLFVLGSIEPENANSIIAKRIADQLESWGHEVHMLGIRCVINSSADKGLQMEKVHLIQQNKLDYSAGLRRIVDQQSVFRWFHLTLKPWYLFELIWRKTELSILQPRHLTRVYFKQTRSIIKEVHPEAVIGYSAPFYAAYGASKAVKGKTFIHYQLDPYSSNVFVKNKRFAEIKEARICRVSKYIIGTSLLLKDYQRTSLRKYLEKLIVAEFPCIRPMSSFRYNELSSTGIITMLYTGSLYPDIRSPRFMLELFESLLTRMPYLRLKIIGKAFGNTGTMLSQYKKKLGDSLQVCEEIDRVKAEKEMMKADFLVNIGNAIPNQLPSKLMDYISTGKPILNIHKLKDCPTLKYSVKYPLCLDIFEEMPTMSDIVENTFRFIRDNTGKCISSDLIHQIYFDCTPKHVADQLLKVLQE